MNLSPKTVGNVVKPILPSIIIRLLKLCYRGLLCWRKPRPYPDDYSYQSNYMGHVPDHGVILDIGGGHNPFPKATILSERFLEITAHRREELVRDERPFVILDIHNLPFKSKSIDYIYCSHVIEHVDDPEQACAELMRVGRAGYIESPTLMKDALFSWAKELNHRWHIVQLENRLVFFEYDPRRLEGIRSTKWQKTILSPYYYPNQDFFYQNLDLFNTILEWVDRFEVVVFRLDKS